MPKRLVASEIGPASGRTATPAHWRGRLLRYLWALPNTLVGLLFAPLTFGGTGEAQIVDGVLELHGPLIAVLLRRGVPIAGGAAAITFGHVVVGLHRHALDVTRRHERVHVQQCEVWGPAFIPAYLIASLWARLSGDDAYEDNYFERQARTDEYLNGCDRRAGLPAHAAAE